MNDELVIALPYPPTGNHSVKHAGGRHWLTAGAKKYRDDVCLMVRAQNAATGFLERLRVVCEIYPPDRRRRDMDNAWKSAGDALTHAGVWKDDFQIEDLRLVRMDPHPGGKVIVTVEVI